MKPWYVTIQIKATEQYFPVILFTMLYEVVLSVWPSKWKLLSSTFMWYCLLCCTKCSHFKSLYLACNCWKPLSKTALFFVSRSKTPYCMKSMEHPCAILSRIPSLQSPTSWNLYWSDQSSLSTRKEKLARSTARTMNRSTFWTSREASFLCFIITSRSLRSIMTSQEFTGTGRYQVL